LVAAVVGFVVHGRQAVVTTKKKPPTPAERDAGEETHAATPTPRVPPQPDKKTIFDGSSGRGWTLFDGTPLAPEHIQPDGLNPHQTGSYLVVYEQPLGDFVLDFDYKLSQGCSSGVLLRIGDFNDPINTGIAVALDDTRRGDDHDSGAFHGLVAPRSFPQKPAGQWNHMTITARGAKLAVSLNSTEVSSINLDLWTVVGKRPDGSDHGFKNRTIAHMARTGYLGFQNLGGDCWFKNVALTGATPHSP
jgi:hypothetical protein